MPQILMTVLLLIVAGLLVVMIVGDTPPRENQEPVELEAEPTQDEPTESDEAGECEECTPQEECPACRSARQRRNTYGD